jgi:chemotaxis protein methyltransferase CheR
MEALNYKDTFAYINYMKFDSTEIETRAFLDLLTTNETYFHRDLPQLMIFVKKVMPVILEHRKTMNNGKRIRLWSAACSVGCEAYTLALLLKEELDDFFDWQFEIIGTDISSSALKVAKDGLYSKREVGFLPSELQRKYFKAQGEFFSVDPTLRSMVQFKYLNLVDEDAMTKMNSFDVVFCRNVMIYFDQDSREQVLDSLYDSMNPLSYIFMGHSEFLSNMSQAFKMERLGRDIVYKKEDI